MNDNFDDYDLLKNVYTGWDFNLDHPYGLNFEDQDVEEEDKPSQKTKKNK